MLKSCFFPLYTVGPLGEDNYGITVCRFNKPNRESCQLASFFHWLFWDPLSNAYAWLRQTHLAFFHVYGRKIGSHYSFVPKTQKNIWFVPETDADGFVQLALGVIYAVSRSGRREVAEVLGPTASSDVRQMMKTGLMFYFNHESCTMNLESWSMTGLSHLSSFLLCCLLKQVPMLFTCTLSSPLHFSFSSLLSLSLLPPRINQSLMCCLRLRMAHLSVSKGIIIPPGTSVFSERWQVQGNFEIIYNDGSNSEWSIIHSCPGE